ncbi:NF038130 family PEP-CTERM protein [Planktothrix rubescens]|uniref:NF038130 family PEP-CTERM protein n=1 Tax=Planktothrix rubescens TaxID=59512 RepID=UPI0004292DC9|nr:NF038130 family PEP-CTERM protein [Planktothrix rubescens]
MAASLKKLLIGTSVAVGMSAVASLPAKAASFDFKNSETNYATYTHNSNNLWIQGNEAAAISALTDNNLQTNVELNYTNETNSSSVGFTAKAGKHTAKVSSVTTDEFNAFQGEWLNGLLNAYQPLKNVWSASSAVFQDVALGAFKSSVGFGDPNIAEFSLDKTGAMSMKTMGFFDLKPKVNNLIGAYSDTNINTPLSKANAALVTINGNITTAQGQINTLNASIITLNQNITNTNNAINVLPGQISTAQTTVNNFTQQVTNAGNNPSYKSGIIKPVALRTTAEKGAITTYNGLNSNLSTAKAGLVTLNGNLSTANTTLVTLNGNLSTANTTLATAQSGLSVLQAKKVDVTAGIATLNAAKQQVDSFTNALGQIQNLQISEIVKVELDGVSEYVYSFNAENSGFVAKDDGKSYSGIYSWSKAGTPAPVPEPSTILGLIAVGGLFGAAKRNANKKA